MPTPQIDETQIAQAAYFMWLDEGQPQGRDQDHWLRAAAALTPAAKKPRVKAAAKRSAAPKANPKAAAKKAAPKARAPRKKADA